MSRSKLGLLGLCAIVFGMMAFAGSAQAEPTAKWLLLNAKKEKVELTDTLLPAVEGIIENKDGSLLTHIIGLPVRVLCETATLENIKLELQGSLTNGGKVVFGGCETFIKEKLEEACKPKGGGGALGTIKTNAGKGLAVLIGGDKRTRIEPSVAGTAFATIEFGEECVLPTTPIFGVLYIKDCGTLEVGNKNFSEHLVKHLIEEDTVNSRLWAISDTAEHLETSIDGSAEVFLGGAHTGFFWGGDV